MRRDASSRSADARSAICPAPSRKTDRRRSTSIRRSLRSTRRATCSSASTRRVMRSGRKSRPCSSRETSTSSPFTRVGIVGKLLQDEDDPLVRAMTKSYADQLAGRLDLQRTPESFRALEQAVKQALAKAEAERRAAPPSQRIAQKPPGTEQRLAIMG